MRDRTLDLQPANGEPVEDVESSKKKGKKGKDKNVESPTNTAATMNQFFEEIANLKESIATIKISVEEIRTIHDRTLNNVTSEKEGAEIARELDAAMDKTNKQTTYVRNKLKGKYVFISEMDAMNKSLQKKDPTSTDNSIRTSQDRMQRQALIEKMTDGEHGQMFAKQIVNTGQRQEAKRALEDIQNKHKEVVKIEKSILELQQLFMDMAVMVAAQGEMINQIAVHVDSAVNDTEAGVQALTKAVKTQKKTRKKMCIIIFLIVAIIAVCVAVPSVLSKSQLTDRGSAYILIRRLTSLNKWLRFMASNEALELPKPEEEKSKKSPSLFRKFTSKSKSNTPNQSNESLNTEGEENKESTSKKALFGKKSKKEGKVAPEVSKVPPTIENFFEQVASIKESLTTIRFLINEIEEIHHKSMQVISDEQGEGNKGFIKEISAELDKKMERLKSVQTYVRETLKDIEKGTKQLKPGDANIPIRKSQYEVLVKNFVQLLEDFKNVQEKYQTKFTERMKKSALIVKPNATPAEVENMIQGQMFTHKVDNAAQKAEARNALEEINRTHKDVLKIESSIKELHQLFVDMAVLVVAQGDYIDNANKHVQNAVTDVEKGVESLEKAVHSQKKTRKRMFCIALLLVILIAIGVAIPAALHSF
ncbi:Plasma membrane t-SNARE, secretory vesicle fusion [Boothiomyces macroporosus]|uniref:Plasma membrane t-SNARE, secretory vesicle fusion n=1 Tax=Boothiomyces macroporosus TaxID=261099 RepID=A0AAD5Y443_9FUNG|nr:Plasma membrane t-SNARE, secretory vesicle fusion [Boothiomyces macroporosus]